MYICVWIYIYMYVYIYRWYICIYVVHIYIYICIPPCSNSSPVMTPCITHFYHQIFFQILSRMISQSVGRSSDFSTERGPGQVGAAEIGSEGAPATPASADAAWLESAVVTDEFLAHQKTRDAVDGSEIRLEILHHQCGGWLKLKA